MMRRARSLGFLALAATGVASAIYLAMHPANLLQDAQVAVGHGRLRAAQLDLDGFLKGHPHNPEASFRLGLVNLLQENGVAAERNLRVARAGGYDPRALIVPLGRAYLLQHRAEEALQDFTAAAAPSGDLAQTQTVRAMALLSLRQIQPARDAAAQALQAAPTDIDANMTAARIEFVDGKLAAADRIAMHVLAIAPDWPEAVVLRADIALARGEAAESLRLAQTVVESSPWRLDAKLQAARALIVLNKDDAATALLDDARRAAPRSADAHYLKAIIAIRHRDYPAADAQLAALSPVLTQLPLGQYLLAVAKLGVGQPAQAQEAISAFVATHPADAAAAQLLALTDLQLGKPDKAQAALQSWIDSGHPDADLLDLLGQAQAMRGETAQAARSLSAAAILAPKNVEVLNRLATAQLRLGDMEAGAAALRQSLARQPDQPDAVEALVQTALTRGDIAAARNAVAALRQAAGESEQVGVLTGRIDAAALDFAAARAAYQNVLDRFPDSRSATFGLLQLDELTGTADPERKRLAAWMKTHPADRDGVAYTIRADVARHDLPAAVAIAEAAHDAAPNDAAFIATLARLYLDTHQPQRAVSLLERTAATPGTSLLPLRAEALAANGNAAEAREAFLQAIDAAPKDATPRIGLMALKLDAHDMDGARSALADGLAAIPGNPQLLQAAVGLEIRASGVKAGLAKAEALQSDPRNMPAAASLTGDVLAASNDQAAAAEAYAAAFHVAPSSVLAVTAGAALARAGRAPAAASLLGEWIRRAPDDLPTLRLLMTMAIVTHDMDAAARWAARILALQPNDVVALNNSAWLKLAQGDLVGARALAQRAYIIAPGADTQDTLGWVLVRQGDAAAALPLLQQAVLSRPSQTVLYHAAFVLKATGHLDDARQAVRRALAGQTPFEERADAEALEKQLGP